MGVCVCVAYFVRFRIDYFCEIIFENIRLKMDLLIEKIIDNKPIDM